MSPLIIKKTNNTPEIVLDVEKSSFIISGESRPDSVRKFYEPVFLWFEECFNQKKLGIIDLNIDFEYFNSTTAKTMHDLIDFVNTEAKKQSVAFKVIWNHDSLDEDMHESGREIEKLTKAAFEYKAH